MEESTLSRELAVSLNVPEGQVAALLGGFAAVLKEKSENMVGFAVPGFGKFMPVMHSEKVVVDKENGKRYLEPPHVEMVFEPSAVLRQKIMDK